MTDEPKPSWPEGARALSYFDPDRPTFGHDGKMLLRPDGSPTNCNMPSLLLTPKPDG